MKGRIDYHFKAVFDIFISLLLLPAVFPLILVICLLLIIPNKGSVFFIQPRTGKNGKIFRVYKFRTLPTDNTPQNKKMIWNFLRRSHLDELPQLLNVFMGNMSLVGPRPLLPEYQAYYDKNSARWRNSVQPGITGLTQVSGGKYLPWTRRFSLDLFYIQHMSFKFDILIFCRTFSVFFRSVKTDSNQQLNNDISYIEYINKGR